MTGPGPIAFARADVAAALAAASSLPVHTGVPERLEPPCIVLTEGTPLLEPSDRTIGAVTVRLVANVIEAPADADLVLNRLDEHVDEIVSGLSAEYMPTVDPYSGVTSADSQRYLAAAVTLTTHLNL